MAVDSLTGFSEAIASVFPRSDIQKCMVHPIRNSLKYVARKDYAAVTAALKPIYKAGTEDGAKLAMGAFEGPWGKKFPMVVRSWRAHWTEWMTVFQYPPDLRKILYTTNLIQGFDRKFRQGTKSKAQFPCDDAKCCIWPHAKPPANGRPGFKTGAKFWPTRNLLRRPNPPALTKPYKISSLSHPTNSGKCWFGAQYDYSARRPSLAWYDLNT